MCLENRKNINEMISLWWIRWFLHDENHAPVAGRYPLPGCLTRALITPPTSAVSKGCNPFFLLTALHLFITDPQPATATALLSRFRQRWWEPTLSLPQLTSMPVRNEVQRKGFLRFLPLSPRFHLEKVTSELHQLLCWWSELLRMSRERKLRMCQRNHTH